MSETRWTPGPWSHYRGPLRPNFGGLINEVQCKRGPPIVKWGGFDESNRSEKKHAANARLIAAAPDLYEALAGTVEEMRSYMRARGWSEDPFPSLKVADAALSRARGDTPDENSVELLPWPERKPARRRHH